MTKGGLSLMVAYLMPQWVLGRIVLLPRLMIRSYLEHKFL